MYCLAPSVYAADIMQLEQQLRMNDEKGRYPWSCVVGSWMAVLSNLSFGRADLYLKRSKGLRI